MPFISDEILSIYIYIQMPPNLIGFLFFIKKNVWFKKNADIVKYSFRYLY